MSCHTCSSGNPAKDIMPVPGDPLLMIQNSCPSGRSCIILPHVKFLGGGAKPAPMKPCPFPSFPWHMAQATGLAVSKKSAFPDEIVSADAGSGLVFERNSPGAFTVLRG